MPTDAAKLIGEQLANVVMTSDGKKGSASCALAIALYGAMKGATALITSLNIAYDETRRLHPPKPHSYRPYANGNIAIIAIIAIAAMGSLDTLFPRPPPSFS
ncbi:MAG: hypothetical protein WKG07_20755 [Hymenobacter sp.]